MLRLSTGRRPGTGSGLGACTGTGTGTGLGKDRRRAEAPGGRTMLPMTSRDGTVPRPHPHAPR
ncbi:hypothetical protein B1H18_21760 [Streptomyces tsukubensis]|uniref:Uncharacterized protein n=1 Tax=Streptomyces tsukubensis TaxID=83656 RepID=A0A1V4A5S1_9ACTN|nr:hypothetical protein B1H18_21760 [Streptomyces tsukubensis]